MTEGTKTDAPVQTPEQQVEAMLAVLQKRLPQLLNVATVYNGAYPPDKTSPDVINAVTVAVTLIDYMLLVGVISRLLVMRQEKVKAAAVEAAGA